MPGGLAIDSGVKLLPSCPLRTWSAASLSVRFARSTAGGITSAILVHVRSVTASPEGVLPRLTRTTRTPHYFLGWSVCDKYIALILVAGDLWPEAYFAQ
jgi:hypothetical protein